MGLSGRKVKQRIPQDPRNLSWADDASRFGSTYLSKLGFDHTDKRATLGVSGVGLAQHLKVHHKLDMLGIGAQHAKDPNGIAWKQNQDFENLLKRLNANAEDPTEGEFDSAIIEGFHPARVNEPVADAASVGSEMEVRDGERKAEKEKKSKKKKRLRGDDETALLEERKSKKRKKVESTTVTTASEPVEVGPPNSNSPTPETTATPSRLHRHNRAHRARFIASKRLAATSSVAVAEILGISSSSVTPLSVSGVATPEVTPQVEDDEHRHLTVSSKSVADYFKERMRLVVSKPLGSEMETDEAPQGGIGSRPRSWNHDEVEVGGGLRGGLGMGLLAKMSAAEVTTEIFVQSNETPEGKRKKGEKRKERKERKRRSEDDEGEVNHKPKKKSKKKEQTASHG